MKLVIVDRDGTICVEREGYIQTPDDWEPLPGALDAIARINQAGYHVVIAANLPGLFQQIGERYKVDLRNIHAVGDSVRDVQAAAAAGCIPHLVLTGKGAPVQTDPLPPEFAPGTRVHADLAAFATAFVAEVEAQQAAARAEADAKADRTAPAPLR